MKIISYICNRKKTKEYSNMEPKVWNTKTDNPKLGYKELADGRHSLYLLYNTMVTIAITARRQGKRSS